MSAQPILRLGFAAALAVCVVAPSQASVGGAAPSALRTADDGLLVQAQWRHHPYGYRGWRHGWRPRPWHYGSRPWRAHRHYWHRGRSYY